MSQKSQLAKDALKPWLIFAGNCQKLSTRFWTEEIFFYLDGTGWYHETKPIEIVRPDKTRTWKNKGESLKMHCTASGKQEGVNRRIVQYMAAIAHSKDVIKCHEKFRPINFVWNM